SLDYKRMNNILITMIGPEQIRRLYSDDAVEMSVHKERWSLMSLEDPELRPTKHFIELRNQEFHSIFHVGRGFTMSEFAYETALRMTKNRVMMKEFVDVLINHIGDAKTRCFQCKLVFADGQDYFHHLMTFAHLQETEVFDTITVHVNLYFAPTVQQSTDSL
ncbi:hypothetical protein PMAYCL1PPCAC_01480, partial [Pristionchus mayeri]